MNRRQSIKTALVASAVGVTDYNIAPAEEDLEGDGLPEGFSEYIDLKEAEKVSCPFHCHIDVSYEDRNGKGFRRECYETDCAEIIIKNKLESGFDLIIEVTPLEDGAWVEIGS